jgi:uracil-DNA glycosylase
MAINSIETFIRMLRQSPNDAAFNPWWQVDRENDIDRNAPGIRRRHLRAYFQERLHKVKLVVIGEALGYRGGHFSGIPMTSERILLGKKKENGIVPEHVFSSIKAKRTSKREQCLNGFSEPTATIVWSSLLKLNLKPEQFVLWKAFPWHSFNPRRGLLSNRMPTREEQSAGRLVLEAFLDLFPCNEIVALGKIAGAQLEQLGVNAHCIRHPASGGAKLFREQIAKLVC